MTTYYPSLHELHFNRTKIRLYDEITFLILECTLSQMKWVRDSDHRNQIIPNFSYPYLIYIQIYCPQQVRSVREIHIKIGIILRNIAPSFKKYLIFYQVNEQTWACTIIALHT